MQKLLLTLAITLISICVFAQNNAESVDILEKVSEKYTNSTATEIKINIAIKDEKTGEHNSLNGTLKAKEKNFILSTSLASIMFDGKFMYTYNKRAKEIMISEPEHEEVKDIDPTAILNSFREGYKISEPTYNNEMATISISPVDIEEDFYKTEIVINTKDYTPKKITTYAKNGVVNTNEIIYIKTNVDINPKEFIFNADNYPKDVQIIDIR